MLAKHIGELLEIVYLDQSGKLSQRRIEIRYIRNGKVYADCLRSGEPRTFREENILAWQPSKAIRPTISVKDLVVAAPIPSSVASSPSPDSYGKQPITNKQQTLQQKALTYTTANSTFYKKTYPKSTLPSTSRIS